MRLIHHVRLGARSQSSAHTLVVGSPRGFLDYEPVQSHLAPGATSHLLARFALGERSRGHFQGTIRVLEGARETVASQLNQNLLLGPRARMDAAPCLAISPHHVQCKHGSATAGLDPNQLAFLAARGFPEALARTMLTGAFLRGALPQGGPFAESGDAWVGPSLAKVFR